MQQRHQNKHNHKPQVKKKRRWWWCGIFERIKKNERQREKTNSRCFFIEEKERERKKNKTIAIDKPWEYIHTDTDTHTIDKMRRGETHWSSSGTRLRN
jgi:DNA-nicking Smr family endonuclease